MKLVGKLLGVAAAAYAGGCGAAFLAAQVLGSSFLDVLFWVSLVLFFGGTFACMRPTPISEKLDEERSEHSKNMFRMFRGLTGSGLLEFRAIPVALALAGAACFVTVYVLG